MNVIKRYLDKWMYFVVNMEIILLMMHKNSETFISEGLKHYERKITPYIKFQMVELRCRSVADVKKQQEAEAQVFLKHIGMQDAVVLLDEKGRQMDSGKFAQALQQYMNKGIRRVVFLTGGAYGFSNLLKERFKESVSLSAMTFSHQLVRLIFAEQLYRALNIIHGGKYHH